MSMSDLEQVKCKDLKKGVDYVLTGDFWPDGGSLVRLVKYEKASLHYKGDRGMVAVVKSQSGTRYVIHPQSYLFRPKSMDGLSAAREKLMRAGNQKDLNELMRAFDSVDEVCGK